MIASACKHDAVTINLMIMLTSCSPAAFLYVPLIVKVLILIISLSVHIRYQMRGFIWPLLHEFKLRPNIVRGSWGWTAPEGTARLAAQPLPDDKKTHPAYSKMKIPAAFVEGALLARNTIFTAAIEKFDFTSGVLTSPKLSCALNFLNGMDVPRDSSWGKKYTDAVPTIIGSWAEEGIARSNDLVLGMWPKHYIHHEIVTGAKGPEFSSWDNMPLRQHVLVALYFPNENVHEVWEFHRQVLLCNEECEDDWSACNLNCLIE